LYQGLAELTGAPGTETAGAGGTMARVKSMVTGLERRFQEIAEIAEMINGVARHTKLLSFNATIEAARAGDAGRGFSVVASEVRNLAERTSAATSTINDMLPQIKAEIKRAVQGVESEESDGVMQRAVRLTGLEAARVLAWFNQIGTTLNGLEFTLQALKAQPDALTRARFNAIMARYLEGNPGLLALSCGMEPGAFDGRDAEYAHQEGSDATGRFLSYWHRGSGRISLEPLVGYDVPGQNEYYELPRRAGSAVMIEPYDYEVGGVMMKITSFMLPVLFKGRFAGVLGADFGLAQLQAQLAAAKPMGTGSLCLLSHGGRYATHEEPARIGQPASDLPPALLRALGAGEAFQALAPDGDVAVLHPLALGAPSQPWGLLLRFNLAAALEHSAFS
jgi:methyl-accepting chemotaxis protein